MKKRHKLGVKDVKPRKRLTKSRSNFVQQVESLEKTFPNFTLDSHEHLTYLINRNFKHSNIHRIERDMLKKSLSNLSDISLFLTHADTSYRSQYYSSPEFLQHMNNILSFRPTKKQNDFDNAITIYSSFVNLGLAGLKRELPIQFDKVLDDMVTPIHNLLDAIRQFSIKYGDKKYQSLERFNSFGLPDTL